MLFLAAATLFALSFDSGCSRGHGVVSVNPNPDTLYIPPVDTAAYTDYVKAVNFNLIDYSAVLGSGRASFSLFIQFNRSSLDVGYQTFAVRDARSLVVDTGIVGSATCPWLDDSTLIISVHSVEDSIKLGVVHLSLYGGSLKRITVPCRLYCRNDTLGADYCFASCLHREPGIFLPPTIDSVTLQADNFVVYMTNTDTLTARSIEYRSLGFNDIYQSTLYNAHNIDVMLPHGAFFFKIPKANINFGSYLFVVMYSKVNGSNDSDYETWSPSYTGSVFYQ
jgi:hypothetical protein